MKKAFIQKLSVAMASALIITAAMPVAQADAAAMKMDKSSKTLYLNEDNSTGTSDTYDFSIKNKGSNYKTKYSFTWYAEDDSIVDVAKGGVVTALKVGQTTVKCDVVTKKTGKLKTTVSSVVTVKANAKTVTIKNAPEGNKMTVGTTFDFNRTMKAANGGSATDKTAWVIDEAYKDIASVDKNGVVTALKAGTFKLYCRTYQSAATKDKTTATSEAVEITVLNSIKSVTASKTNELTVTFGSPVSAADIKATDFVVTNKATSVRSYVSGVTVSADGLTATLKLYNALTSGSTYEVAYDGLTGSVDYVKGEVAKITISAQTIPAGTASDIVYNVFDANGLDITADTNVTVVSSVSLTGNQLQLADGEVSYVYVMYTHPTTGETIVSDTVAITGSSSAATAINGAVIATAGTASTALKFDGSALTIAKDATNKVLFVQVSDQYNKKYVADPSTSYKVKYETLTSDIIVVDETSGALTPVTTGVGYVKVTANGLTQTYAIQVKDSAKASSYTVSATTGSMTGLSTGRNNPTVSTTVLDQYGSKFTTTDSVTFELISGDGVVATAADGTLSTAAGSTKTFTALANTTVTFTPVKAGTAVFKVTFGSLGTKTVSVRVTAENKVTAKYAIDGAKDFNIAYAYGETTDTANGIASASLSLWSQNSSGEYIADMTSADNHNVEIRVINPSGAVVATGTSVAITANDVKGYATGTYTVEALDNNVKVASTTFKVVDTATAPSITLKDNTYSLGNAGFAAVSACVKFDTANYSIDSFSYTSGNSTITPSTNGFVAEIAGSTGVSNTVTLYNVVVKIKSNTTDRVYTSANLGNITVK